MSNSCFSSDQGVVYVYTNTGGIWSLSQTITANDPTTNMGFGIGVASDGTTLFVGAYFKASMAGNYQGLVCVFTLVDGVWTQKAQRTRRAPPY